MIAQENKEIRLKCSGCPAKDTCPRFDPEPAAICWYEEHDVRPDLNTADGILSVFKEKIQLDYVRYQRAMRGNTAVGRMGVDKSMTQLSNTITRDLGALVDLSVRFGRMDEKEKPKEQQVPMIKADHVNVNVLNVASKEEIEQCQALQQELELLRRKRQLLEQIQPL